jgi:GNAT superfamily N-acetyltransferase
VGDQARIAGLAIRAFTADDQDAARRVILAGLGEHFGEIDEGRNPDLNDIAASYRDGVFLVALQDGALVGTGALVRRTRSVGQIVRMSVDRQYRRRGIASAVLAGLLDEARASGYRWAMLGTNDDWADALAFYEARSFTEIGRAFGGAGFARDLCEAGRPPSTPRRWLLFLLLAWRYVRSG